MVLYATRKKLLRKSVIVLGSLFAQMASVGMSVSFGIVYKEVRNNFGTNQSDSAWAASIYNGLIGFVGIFLGIVTRHVGERRVAVVGAIVLSLGMLTSMFAKNMSIIYVTYGVIGGLGAGSLNFCANTILGPHFDDKWRPIAMATGSIGVPLSALIMPPVMTALIERFDWKKAFLFLSGVSLIGVPSSLAFIALEQTGVTKDEDEEYKEHGKAPLKRLILELVTDLNFALYVCTSIAVLSVMFVPSTFLPDLMNESNRSSHQVSTCLITFGIGNIFGRIAFGLLAYRFTVQLPLIHAVATFVFGIGTISLIAAETFGSFLILSGISGLGSGGYSALYAVMAAHLVSPEHLPIAFGLVMSISGIAIVGGMPFAGYLTDTFRTESASFVFASCMAFIGSLLTTIIRIRQVCGLGNRNQYVIEEQEVEVYSVSTRVETHTETRYSYTNSYPGMSETSYNVNFDSQNSHTGRPNLVEDIVPNEGNNSAHEFTRL